MMDGWDSQDAACSCVRPSLECPCSEPQPSAER